MRLLLATAALACVHADGTASQRVTVDAPAPRSTTAVVRLWQRGANCWRPVAGPWRAHVGRNGLSSKHREGDATTPVGSFGIEPTVYGSAPSPGVRYRYRQLGCGDWWDEDPASPTYNRFRHVGCGTRPRFAAASDPLWLSPRAYRHFAVLDFNTQPTVPGRGSAIFIHADVGEPTSGCVSLPAPQLVRLLRWLRPDARPIVVIRVTPGSTS